MSDDLKWKLARRVEAGQKRSKTLKQFSKTVKKYEFIQHARMCPGVVTHRRADVVLLCE